MRQIIVPVTLLFLLASISLAEEIYPGYSWQDLGNGIYVHTRNDPFAGPVDGNSTVIVNDEDVFVVDTHINPAVARAVIAKIREVTDKPVTKIVNTHWHDDHTNGNHAYRQAFPESKIFSHHATLESLKKEWRAFEDQRQATYESLQGRDLLAAADEIEAEDPQRAIGVRVFAGYREALEPELPSMELIYPDMAFEDSTVFERGERTIVLQWMGRGNTDGDVVVWLPKEQVLITGDMLVAPIPYAFDSPMIDWIDTLGKAAELGATSIIPGHGAVQRDNHYLEQVVSLLEATIAAVRNAKASGVSYADLSTVVDLKEYEELFSGGDPISTYAWNSYYLGPGLKSAWTSPAKGNS